MRPVFRIHEKTPVNGWKLDMMHYISTFDHFWDNAACFISLLKTVRDKSLTLEDFVIAHGMLEDALINPSMPGAFEHAFSPDTDSPCTNTALGASADEIEKYAMKSIAELTAIMN